LREQSAPPILLRFPPHRRAGRVLHLEPVGRAARTVGGILSLRDNAFEAKLASVGENGRPVALDMLVEAEAKASFGQHTSKRGLTDLKRITPQVVAVQLDEVEGVEEDAVVSALVTDEIERGDTVVIAGDSFTVDDAGARAQCQRVYDQREAA